MTGLENQDGSKGHAQFVAPGIVDDDAARVSADAFVIATGSEPVVPACLKALRDKVLATESLFGPDALPGTIGVPGLGPSAWRSVLRFLRCASASSLATLDLVRDESGLVRHATATG